MDPISKIVEDVVKECRSERCGSTSPGAGSVVSSRSSSSSTSSEPLTPPFPKEGGHAFTPVTPQAKFWRPPGFPFPPASTNRPSQLRTILMNKKPGNHPPTFTPVAPMMIPNAQPFYGYDTFGRTLICFPIPSTQMPSGYFKFPAQNLNQNLSTQPFVPQQINIGVKRNTQESELEKGMEGYPESKKRRRCSLINQDVQMDHVDLLYDIINQRKTEYFMNPTPENLKKLTECRLCENCSFSSDPSTHWEFMKKHIYAHLPNGQSAFSCGLCQKSHVTCLSKVRSHIKKCHGDEYIRHPNAIQDHREGMDQFLIELVQKCFGGKRELDFEKKGKKAKGPAKVLEFEELELKGKNAKSPATLKLEEELKSV